MNRHSNGIQWWQGLLASIFLTITPLSAAEAPAPPQTNAVVRVTKKASKNPGLELPDPLVSNVGRKIRNTRDWRSQRRDELLGMFERIMYGKLPPKPSQVETKVLLSDPNYLEGMATLKVVRLEIGPGKGPQIDLLMVIPNRRMGPVPAFLSMNFCGNHALLNDPRIPLTRGYLYKNCKGCDNGHASEASRGSQVKDWPIDQIIDRGYALISFASTDIDSDRGNVSDGIFAWMAEQDPLFDNRPENRGTIAAWAWGYHRAMDYLETDRDIDAKRVAAVGHSRNGKTALLAAAFDERIALAIPHQAGCGGTAPSRGTVGESVKAINDRFPHWFNAKFKEFNDETQRLPIDQNCLVALMAPRPVLLSNAEEDTWANPDGQFEVLQGAAGVYRLFGHPGVETTKRPPIGMLLKGRLGYYIRPGKHSMTAEDWGVFMNYADTYLKKRATD